MISKEAEAWLVVRAKYHYGEYNDVVVRELDRELEDAGLYINGYITPEGENYLTRDEVVAEGVVSFGNYRTFIDDIRMSAMLPRKYEGKHVQVIVRVIKEDE